MGEASPLVRQWILLRTLCARHHGATVKELSAEMGVSEKTIRRDLETFQTAGFPLIETVEQFGRKKWRIDPSKNQPGMCFAYDEAIALYLGRRFLEPLAGTVFWEAAQRAFRKIRASLGKEALKYVDQFATVFHQTMVGVSDYSQKADLIDDLMVAIEDRRAVFITYQSLRATEPVTYDIYPFGLTYHRGSLYLVGSCRRSTTSHSPLEGRSDRGRQAGGASFQPARGFRSQRPLCQVVRRLPRRRRGPRQGPLLAHGRPLRPGIHLARQPEAHQARGRQPVGRVRPGRYGRDHAMDSELRATRGGVGARVTCQNDTERNGGNGANLFSKDQAKRRNSFVGIFGVTKMKIDLAFSIVCPHAMPADHGYLLYSRFHGCCPRCIRPMDLAYIRLVGGNSADARCN